MREPRAEKLATFALKNRLARLSAKHPKVAGTLRPAVAIARHSSFVNFPQAVPSKGAQNPGEEF
jgi:hypothetical protein